MSEGQRSVCVYLGEELGRYAFGAEHPFGPMRLPAFEKEFRARGLQQRVDTRQPVSANAAQIAWFHTPEYITQVKTQSANGKGYLDYGDTPAFKGVYEAAATVVGSVLDAVEQVTSGEYGSAFVPIAGLHHARRNRAAGFCVFNDCAIAIEALRRQHGIGKVAYVDIDAHHGDGVYFGFAGDPDLTIVDFHEDGRYLYPGTGTAADSGEGAARGTKLNISMPPGAGDEQLFARWDEAEQFLRGAQPEFILLQAGADSLGGDPITDLRYTSAVHRHVTQRLCALASESCEGRLVVLGGGGYRLENLADAWCAVVEALAAHCGG